MPYSYEVDTDERIAYVRSWGRMDIEESLQAPVELSHHPDYRPDFGVVVDLLDVQYQPRAADVVAVARNLIQLRKLFSHRVGIVTVSHLARAGELVSAIAGAGGFPLRVFTDLDEAFLWVRPAPESIASDWALEDPD